MLPQTSTLKKDGIQEKLMNPLSSDIIQHNKSNTNLKRKTSESNTLANKNTEISSTTEDT